MPIAPSAKPVTRSTEALLEELHRLPVHNATALRVLALLEDPEVLIGDIGGLIQGDPALTARVLKLANSSFFGLRNDVASIDRAIMTVGLATVRTFTLAAAFDLFSDRGANLPADFWSHAIVSAAGATVLAKHLRQPTGDAFSAGLLHDLGVALLFRHAPDRYDAVIIAPGLKDDELCEAERAEFGIDHAEAAATVLRACRFPKPLIDAIGGHHEPVKKRRLGRPDLGAIVAVGEHLGMCADEELARSTEEGHEVVPTDTTVEMLDAVGLEPSTYRLLLGELNASRAEVEAFVHG